MNYANSINYKVCRQQLDAIYKKNARGKESKSKCDWYEYGGKTTKFSETCEKLIESKVKYILLLLTNKKSRVKVKQKKSFLFTNLYFDGKFRMKSTR